MERGSHAIKVSLRLDSLIYAALQKEALAQGRDIGDYMQRVFTRHAIDNKLVDEASGQDYELRESLVDRAVEFAQMIKRAEGITRDITNKAVIACMTDEQWLANYAVYVRDDPFRHKNPRKAINKEIGLRIRRAIGAKVARSSDGKPIKTPVSDSIIQSFTEMEPCEQVKFGEKGHIK
jgi:hypothetical protein